MSLSEKLSLIIDANVQGAVRGFEQVGAAAEKHLAKAEGGIDRFGTRLRMAGPLMVGFGAVALVGLGKAAKASEEADLATLRLQNSLKNNPKLAGQNIKPFEDLAKAIQHKTAADDDAVISGLAMLGTFQVTGQQMREITPLVVDYARKFKVDLVDANKQVGKALDGNVAALKRNGVSIDETMFKTDRFGAVLKGLKNQVGGFAEEEGKTFSGSLERLKNELRDIEEGVGKGAVNAFSTLLGSVDKMTGAFNSLSPAAQSTIGEVATFGAVGLVAAGAASTLIGWVIKMRTNFSEAGIAIKGAASHLSGVNWKSAAIGAGVLTATIGALTLAYELNQAQSARNKKEIDDLAAALKRGGEAGKAAASAVQTNALAAGKFGSELRKAGVDLRDITDALVAGRFDADKWTNVLVQSGSAMDLFARNARAAGLGQDDLGKALLQVADSGQFTRIEFEQLIGRLNQLQTNTDKASESNKNLASANQSNAEATKKAKDATEDYASSVQYAVDAVKLYTDRVLDSANAALGFEDAEAKVIDSVNDYTQALDDAKKPGTDHAEALRNIADKSRDAERAILAAGDAAIAAAAAQRGLTADQITGADKNAVLRGEFEKLAAALAPGSPLRVYIEGLIARLDEAARDRVSHLRLIVDQPNTVYSPRTVVALAEGGVIKARPGGTLALIGEGGHDEAVIPLNKPGMVQSTHGSTGGVTLAPVINVSAGWGADGRQIGAEIVNALAAWARQNGRADLKALLRTS